MRPFGENSEAFRQGNTLPVVVALLDSLIDGEAGQTGDKLREKGVKERLFLAQEAYDLLVKAIAMGEEQKQDPPQEPLEKVKSELKEVGIDVDTIEKHQKER